MKFITHVIGYIDQIEIMFMNQMNYTNAIDHLTCHQFSYFISHMILMVFLKPFFCVIIILVSVMIKEFNKNWEPHVSLALIDMNIFHHHLSYVYQSHANLLFLPTLDLNFKYDFSSLSLAIINHSYDILGARMLWKPKEARILKNF